MGYSYEEELDMYMDDDGHMFTEDMLPKDMQERLRMQRIDAAESKMAQEELNRAQKYYEDLKKAYLTGDKEAIIKFSDHEIGSQYEFACIYSDEERKESIAAIEKAGEIGHIPAIEYLASIYNDGVQNCMKPNLDKFLYWAEKGMASDNHEFLSFLGSTYLGLYEKEREAKYFAAAKQVCTKAAELGSYSAMFNMYKIERENGRRCDGLLMWGKKPEYTIAKKEHFKKAFDYLVNAASTLNCQYRNTLGLEYLQGTICEKDEKAAFKSFYDIANMYDIELELELMGIKKKDISDEEADENITYEGISILASRNFVPAYYNLAYCYENGMGCEVNKEKAFELYSAIKKLSRNARMKVAYCYENGIGVEKNIEKALKIYKAVAKKAISHDSNYIEEPF